MKKYEVTMTKVYNGSMTIFADNEKEAVEYAREHMTDADFSLGEITVDYAEERDDDYEFFERDGKKYPCREIESLNDDMLTTWVVGPESMKNGWGDDASTYPSVDDMYFCYVPDAVFNEYSDSQLAEYIARNFLC